MVVAPLSWQARFQRSIAGVRSSRYLACICLSYEFARPSIFEPRNVQKLHSCSFPVIVIQHSTEPPPHLNAMSQHHVHPTPERLETAFEKLETYNKGQVKVAEAQERQKVKARRQSA